MWCYVTLQRHFLLEAAYNYELVSQYSSMSADRCVKSSKLAYIHDIILDYPRGKTLLVVRCNTGNSRGFTRKYDPRVRC